MLEAAIRGLIDPATARPFDKRWRARLFWLVRGLYQQRLREGQRIVLQLHLAYLGLYPYLTEQGQGQLSRAVQKAYQSYLQDHLPWQDWSQTEHSEADQLMQLWARQWGDPRSPEGQERIRRAIRQLLYPSRTQPTGEQTVQQTEQLKTMLREVQQAARRSQAYQQLHALLRTVR